MSELKSRLPLLSRIINKTNHQNELINNLENVFIDIQNKYKNLSVGDFPEVENMKVQIIIFLFLKLYNISFFKFNRKY